MATTKMFIVIASQRYGVSAYSANAPATSTPTTASSRRPTPGSEIISRDANGTPTRMPRTAPGCVAALMKPRSATLRWNTWS